MDGYTQDDLDRAEWAERTIAPCCGEPVAYCECSPYQRDYALIVAAAMEDCPPAPRMAEDDPRRDEIPPF
jgi:hypothetical protein